MEWPCSFSSFSKSLEAGAVGDGGFVLDGAAGKQQGIDQGGFPATAVADEEDVSDVTRCVGRHEWLLGRRR